MEKYCATSDVKCTVGDNQTPPSAGLPSNALPEVRTPIKPTNSQTGVSTNNVLSKTSTDTNKDTKETPHWYTLRTTYGREKKAYDYLLSKGVEAFYPTLKSVKLVDSKRITVEESRIPNIFFAYGTEEELKSSITTILDIIKKYPGKDNIYLHIRDNKEGMINQNCIDIEEGYKELSRIFKEKINMY